MAEWGVTDAGYELLEKIGLDKRIEEKWKEIEFDQLPRGAFVEDWEVEDILKADTPKERRINVEKYLKENKGYDRKPEDLFMVSGKITDMILTRDEQSNIQQFGVKNLSQIDGLIAAFCLSKDSDNPLGCREYYTWRSKGLRTQIYSHADGDLQIHQIETTPKEKNDLFGKLAQNHINADYSNWPVAAATALKYADTVRVEIPEAKNWQKLLEQKGWDGTIKKLGNFGVGYERFVPDYFESIIAQLPDKTDVRNVKKMFFGYMTPNASHDVFYLPVIDLDQNLVFFSNSGSGQVIELAPLGQPINCYPRIKIPKSDISHLFKGAVNGIMMNQSRTRPEFLALMLWEYDQIKAGRTEDEIRDAERKYERFG